MGDDDGAMRDELRATLRRSGATTLFVTHDQEDAFAIADRVAVLAFGQLLQVGAPEALYQQPASREVASFIGRATLVPAVDRGTTAAITLGGREMIVAASRADGSPAPFARALAVLRPEALTLVAPGDPEAWPGEIVHARFAGGTLVYRVQLAPQVVCEVSATSATARTGDRVGVRVQREPIALVAG